MPKDAAYGQTPWGEAKSKFQDRIEKELMKIPSADREGIRNFSNGDYRACRASEKDGPDGPLNDDAKAIKRAFAKGRPEPGSSWRGITVPEATANKMIRNDGVHRLGNDNTPGTTSTSWRFGVAREWSGGTSDPDEDDNKVRIKYLIHHRSGIPIDPISRNGGEDEVLIPADAQFRCLGISRLEGKKRVIFIELEEIPPGEEAGTAATPAAKPKRTRKPKAT